MMVWEDDWKVGSKGNEYKVYKDDKVKSIYRCRLPSLCDFLFCFSFLILLFIVFYYVLVFFVCLYCLVIAICIIVFSWLNNFEWSEMYIDKKYWQEIFHVFSCSCVIYPIVSLGIGIYMTWLICCIAGLMSRSICIWLPSILFEYNLFELIHLLGLFVIFISVFYFNFILYILFLWYWISEWIW